MRDEDEVELPPAVLQAPAADPGRGPTGPGRVDPDAGPPRSRARAARGAGRAARAAAAAAPRDAHRGPEADGWVQLLDRRRPARRPAPGRPRRCDRQRGGRPGLGRRRHPDLRRLRARRRPGGRSRTRSRPPCATRRSAASSSRSGANAGSPVFRSQRHDMPVAGTHPGAASVRCRRRPRGARR